MTSRPLHLVIIPDGNRRWARSRGLNPWKGHEQAIEMFRTISEWCRTDPRVSILTVWCFSTENWKRNPREIAMLMRMLEEYLRKERSGFVGKDVRFLHSGRKDRIPPSLAKLLAEVEEETKRGAGFTLHLAVDYGGKDELLRATKSLCITDASTIPPITEETLRSHFDQPSLPDIDLVIRTSGEMRTSNFFLWQAAFAEWAFTEKLFPDFMISDMEEALAAYENRTRRLGS